MARSVYISWPGLSTPAGSLGRSVTGDVGLAEETSVLTHIHITLTSPGHADAEEPSPENQAIPAGVPLPHHSTTFRSNMVRSHLCCRQKAHRRFWATLGKLENKKFGGRNNTLNNSASSLLRLRHKRPLRHNCPLRAALQPPSQLLFKQKQRVKALLLLLPSPGDGGKQPVCWCLWKTAGQEGAEQEVEKSYPFGIGS